MKENRRQFYQELLRQKSAVIGASILIFFIITALFAPLIATHDPRDADVTARLKGWSKIITLERIRSAGIFSVALFTVRRFRLKLGWLR